MKKDRQNLSQSSSLDARHFLFKAHFLNSSSSDSKIPSPKHLLSTLTILIPNFILTKSLHGDQPSEQLQTQSPKTIEHNSTDRPDLKHPIILPPTERSILNESGDISSMVTDTTEAFNGSEDTKKLLVQYLSHHPMLKSFLVGALSGTCSTLLFQPFDLLKTRVQSANISIVEQRQHSSTTMVSVRNTRFVPIMMDVIKNEQLIGLWRGTVPSLFRCVPGVGIHFCCLDTLQSHFCPDRKPSPLEAMLFGMLSRSIASALLIPVTVVKTRFESGIYSYKNITDALRHTYQNEGLRGLKSGLLPTLMRDVPFSGLYFMFYSQFKSFILNNESLRESTYGKPNSEQYSQQMNLLSSSSLTFICGLSAGLMASIVTQPMDVVKTRMQLDSKQFPNFLKTILYIVKKEKMRGLFSGLVPRMMRRTLMAAMAWTVYEQMMKSLCLK